MTWPLNGSEAGVDLVLIQTSLLLLCKSSCSYANYLAFSWEKQRGLYQSKVISSLACIHGQATKHTTVKWPIREFTKPRRQRQRERRWTKELMSRTMVLHVRYNCWYISVSSSSKRRREMTKFCVVWRTWTTTANFLNFYIKFIAVFRIYFRDSFDSDKQS